MPGAVISEQELAHAEKLRGRGEFSAALRLTQGMLSRAEDDGTRMRLLFDLLYCSTQLRLDEITGHAIAELERLPEPKISQLIAGFIKAISLIARGEAAKGLDLIEANLKSEFMEKGDFRVWKYRHLAYKGSALIGLPAVSR